MDELSNIKFIKVRIALNMNGLKELFLRTFSVRLKSNSDGVNLVLVPLVENFIEKRNSRVQFERFIGKQNWSRKFTMLESFESYWEY